MENFKYLIIGWSIVWGFSIQAFSQFHMDRLNWVMAVNAMFLGFDQILGWKLFILPVISIFTVWLIGCAALYVGSIVLKKLFGR